MYLSRLVLNPRNRRVQREITEPYEMHRTIMQSFPDELDPQERILFRLDSDRSTDTLKLLVQSQFPPDWSWLEDPTDQAYLMQLEEPNPWVKAVELSLQVGQRLRFRLRANPTVKRKGKRLGLYRESQQWEWLERKSAAGGFKVCSARMVDQNIISGPLFRDGHRHDLRLLIVQFDGLLEVVNPSNFSRMLRQGIGSGKGFGCGLLSVGPA